MVKQNIQMKRCSRVKILCVSITDLSKIVINMHQYFDNDYNGTHDQCLTDLTSGTGWFNLNAFVDYLKRNQLQAMVTSLVQKKTVNHVLPL